MTRYSALALVLIAASTAGAAEKKVERTFAVSPGGSLVVDADSASVRVSGGDTNQVTVRMTARGSEEDLANMKLDAIQKGDGVTVTMRRPAKKGWFNSGSWNAEQRIEVTVPQRYEISIHSSGGDVELTDTTGSAKLGTSGGDIVARNINGNVELRTSGGGISADKIRSDVDADTSGGDIRLLNVDGKIRGQTSGGSVKVSLVGTNRGIFASTSGGDIQLTLPRATTGNLEATTSGGEIDSDLPLTTREQREGHLEGSINGGGQSIRARTSGGGISLRASN